MLWNQGECVLCHRTFIKREMNNLYLAFGHTSVRSQKLLCAICDDCLPTLLDTLGVSEPERKVKWGSTLSGRYCQKCYHDVGKTALYCSHCGEKLKKSEVTKL